MSELRIRNWDKWQSYRSDRGQPPWIKVHRRLLLDPNWVTLTDAQKGQLISIWMLAAERNGTITDDVSSVRKLCHLDTDPDINLFIEKGFLDAKVTPRRRRADANVTPQSRVEERRGEERRVEVAATPPAYAWVGSVIRLNHKNYAEWLSAYSHLDLPAELLAYDHYLSEQGASGNWFPRVSKYLANRNMEAKAKGEVAARPPPERLSRTELASRKIEQEMEDGTFGGSEICIEHNPDAVGLLPEPSSRPGGVTEAANYSLHWAAKGGPAEVG
jgi:hypothetical protein